MVMVQTNFLMIITHFYTLARIAATPQTENNHYEIGLNAGYSDNSNQGIFTKSFNGKKTFFGGDIRAEIHDFLFSTEINYEQIRWNNRFIQSNKEPYGYHITLGYKPFSKHQFLIRYDNLSADVLFQTLNYILLVTIFGPLSCD